MTEDQVETPNYNLSQTVTYMPNSQIKVTSKCNLGETNTKIFCCKFDYDDKYIAAACESGEVRVFNVATESLSHVIPSTIPNTPFSYVRWRPPRNDIKTRNVFATVNSEGQIQHWHLNSGKCMNTIQPEKSMDPQLNCIDYSADATEFVVAGSEPIIRIYDEETKQLKLKLGGDGMDTPGHSSRIYCCKLDKENPNLLLTGGWDYRCIVWDAREFQKKPIRDIYGPLICGDGIDIQDDVILTSSWTQTNQLQLWDIKSAKLITTIDWDANLKTSTEPAFLYSGQFSKVDGSLIIAGGSNSNEVKLFDRNNFEKAFCSIHDISKDISSVDFSNKGSQFCMGGGDGLVRIFNMNITA